ncbi:MAG TPA: type I glyceraldehyde-3-phosphate dehydrogenase [Egibacteraceae bacterium]|nr:type I glyceraldehyde-3-phosphate dehydrogenase [Actinomycetota bacterium]HWB72881.1 type I glyceraldehyde-3-phosphate dehydrogenase [Egibacteraceae bacterium]
MTTRIGINGFGRIGRNFFRALKESGADVDVVAVNDITDNATLAHLLRFDSIYGRWPGTVETTDDGFAVDGDEIRVLTERNPADLPWKDLGADIVIESTGLFTDREHASGHLEAGAQKVIVSAPADNEDLTVVMGANEGEYDPANHHVLSVASCTTNCIVPMAKVLHEAFGIERGFMTTVHAYTNDQSLHDMPHKDLRRARAGALSTIPTSTGAAKATSKPLPDLEGRMDGIALRVPVPVGSITDFVATLQREASVDEVNDAFREAAEGSLKGIVEVTTEPLVSTDIVGNPHSCVFDEPSTMAIGPLVKVLGWYDNEWGFSNRMVEFTVYVGERL